MESRVGYQSLVEWPVPEARVPAAFELGAEGKMHDERHPEKMTRDAGQVQYTLHLNLYWIEFWDACS